MNPNKISSADPRLTAYALNEMAPAERTEFEQLLAEDAAARQAVEEIAATASLLTDALEHEALEPCFAEATQGKPGKVEGNPPARHDTYAKVIQFPYWRISGLAAACFAVFFIYWQRHELVNEPKQYIEVPLAPAPAADVPESEAAATTTPTPREAERANRDERQSVALARMARQEQEGAVKEQMIAARNEAIESATKKARAAATPMPAAGEARKATPASMAAGKPESKEETIVLSPFEVTAQDKVGYAGTSTLAGSRVQTELKDGATATTVATGRFSADRASEGDATGLRQDHGDDRTGNQPLSTLGGKMAAASYAEVRRFLIEGRHPPAEVVRVEELVNHFSYNYAPPPGNAPFSANLEVAGAPWAPTHRLVRIGLKAHAAGAAVEYQARVEPTDGRLVIVAKDVQIQAEFNPTVVQAYRLIGYENRRAAQEEPDHAGANVGIDGTDQALTVLYEVVPVGVEMPDTDNARQYERPQGPRAGIPLPSAMEMLTVEIRYKEPTGGANRRLEFPLRDRGTAFAGASEDFKFAAAVASFGMVLRDSPFKGAATWGAVAAWARDGLGDDVGGQRGEFLGLVKRAQALQ